MTITQHTRRRVADAIPDKGATLRQLSESSGVHISNVRMVARLLEAEGAIFTMRAGTGENCKHELWAFKTEAARDEFAESWLDEIARREKARQDARTEKRRADRHAEGRSMIAIAAERREARKRVEREREEEQRRIEALKLKAAQGKLKKQTASLGAQVFKTGTLSPKPIKSAWQDLPTPDLSKLPKIELPCFIGNKHDTKPEEVTPCFSSLRPGQYIAPASSWVEAIAA